MKNGSLSQIDFFIIGAQKSGTTALHSFFSNHPDICMSVNKELHLFDSDDVEASALVTHHDLNSEFKDAREDQLLGEATPNYLFWPLALEKLKRHNSEARLLVILRNPIERAYSQYVMELRCGDEKLPFSEAIRAEKDRVFSDGVMVPGFSLRHYSYVYRGFYHQQLERCFEFFDKEQVLVLLAEELQDSHESILSSIYNFLGVSSDIGFGIQTKIAAPYGAMAEEDWSYLESIFAEEINQLEVMLGRSLDCWRQQRWPGTGKICKSGSNKGIVVLGMHRSGTSAITRLLNIMGCDLGTNLVPPAKCNELGFWENQCIVNTHEKLLGDCNRDWATCRPITQSWWKSSLAADYRRELSNLIRVELSFNSLWGIKDPRTCRLLPLWLHIFKEQSLDVRFLLPFRHPNEVSDSLEKRDGMPQHLGHLLWAAHNLEAERLTRGHKRTFVNYSDCLEDWHSEMLRVEEQLEIRWAVDWDIAQKEVEDFLTPSLRHHHSTDSCEPDLYIQIYDAFLILIDDPHSKEACNVLDEIYNELFHDDGAFRKSIQDTLDIASEANRKRLERALGERDISLHESKAMADILEGAYEDILNRLRVTIGDLQIALSEAAERQKAYEARNATIGARIGQGITTLRSKLAPSGSVRNKIITSLADCLKGA